MNYFNYESSEVRQRKRVLLDAVEKLLDEELPDGESWTRNFCIVRKARKIVRGLDRSVAEFTIAKANYATG